MIDEKYIKGTTGESKNCTVIYSGNAISTVRSLYYKEPRDEDYINFIDVVCCKDCKWCDITDYGAGKVLECILDRLYRINSISLEGETYFREVEPDDFCAWGERKEDANNS